MTDKEYLQLWRTARELRSDYSGKTTIDIESLPVGSTFFGLLSEYEPVPIVDHDAMPKVIIDLFVSEYNQRHERPITVDDFVGDDTYE